VQNETKIRPPIMATINVMAKLSNGCGGVGPVRSQRRRIVSEPADSLVSQVIFIEIDTHLGHSYYKKTRFYFLIYRSIENIILSFTLHSVIRMVDKQFVACLVYFNIC